MSKGNNVLLLNVILIISNVTTKGKQCLFCLNCLTVCMLNCSSPGGYACFSH